MAKSTKANAEREYERFLANGSRDALRSRRRWIEKFITIPDKHDITSLVHLRPNRVQRDLEATRIRCERSGKPLRLAILKARQFGCTLWALAWQIEEALRTPGAVSCIVADDEKLARDILERAKGIRRRLPWALATRYENRSQLYFDYPIFSTVDIASARDRDPCRGQTYRFLHCTEPGTWSNPETKVASINQAVPMRPGTIQCYEGTGRGRGNWWYDFWWQAERGENDYIAKFYSWLSDPDFDYSVPVPREKHLEFEASFDTEELELRRRGAMFSQLNWRRMCIKNNFFGNVDLFRQEYPSTPDEAFIAGGTPVFPYRHVAIHKARRHEPVWIGDFVIESLVHGEMPNFIQEANPRGAIKIFEHPLSGHRYIIGSDTGHGTSSGDFSTGVVIDRETGTQVAELECQFDPHQYSDVLCALAWHYNTAYLMPEVNSIGTATLSFLVDRGYPNIGRRPVFDYATRAYVERMGWITSNQSKEVLVQLAREVLAKYWLAYRGNDRAAPLIHSERLIQQVIDYQLEVSERDVITYNAPGNQHDDLVIAWMIALISRKDVLATEETVVEAKRKPLTETELAWIDFSESINESGVPVGAEDDEGDVI